MQKPNDIYHEESTPRLAKKRSRRHSSKHEKYARSAAESIQRSAAAKRRYVKDGKPPEYGVRRGRRSTRKMQPAPKTHFLWFGLALVVLGYCAVLTYLLLKNSTAPVKPETEEAVIEEMVEEPTEPTLPTSEDDLKAVNTIIARTRATEKVMDMAKVLVRDEQLGEAAKRLEQALVNAPDDHALKSALAMVYVQQKRNAEARDLLLNIIETNPDDLEARLALANVFLAQKHFQPALEIAQWILGEDPYSMQAHSIAADAYLNTDRTGWALPHLRKITSLDRDNVPARSRLALAYAQLKEYSKATDILNQLLKEGHADSSIYFNLAICLAQQGKAGPTIDTLKQARDLYGKSFVYSWIPSNKFDPIRQNQAFVAFAREISPIQETTK
jgi:Flp pilus assembly protein TadD